MLFGASQEDTPLRRLVLSLNLDPVNDSRRAACVAYQPLPAQQAFQIGTRTLRNSILKALANNRRQLLATSPALAQLSSPVSDEDILSGGQRAVGIEVRLLSTTDSFGATRVQLILGRWRDGTISRTILKNRWYPWLMNITRRKGSHGTTG